MPGLYSHTTRGTGTVLTDTLYNGDHVNHITNQELQQTDDYSASVAQMKSNSDPGDVGSEVLATSAAIEIERLRAVLIRIQGGDQWYRKTNLMARHQMFN